MAVRDTAPRFIDEDESRPPMADEPAASGRANRWITWVLLGVLAIGIAVVAMSFFSASQSGDLNRDTAQVGTPGASSQTGTTGSTGSTGTTGSSGTTGSTTGTGGQPSNQTGTGGSGGTGTGGSSTGTGGSSGAGTTGGTSGTGGR
ncbi:MAG TPA: hypothetical protein VH257_15850 [Chloroflexota bacterium]|nr:hypothetical protein [Chloroflexota bacterium]